MRSKMINIQLKTTETYQKVKKTSCLLRAQGLNLVGSGRVLVASLRMSQGNPMLQTQCTMFSRKTRWSSPCPLHVTSCPLPRWYTLGVLADEFVSFWTLWTSGLLRLPMHLSLFHGQRSPRTLANRGDETCNFWQSFEFHVILCHLNWIDLNWLHFNTIQYWFWFQYCADTCGMRRGRFPQRSEARPRSKLWSRESARTLSDPRCKTDSGPGESMRKPWIQNFSELDL